MSRHCPHTKKCKNYEPDNRLKVKKGSGTTSTTADNYGPWYYVPYRRYPPCCCPCCPRRRRRCEPYYPPYHPPYYPWTTSPVWIGPIRGTVNDWYDYNWTTSDRWNTTSATYQYKDGTTTVSWSHSQ